MTAERTLAPHGTDARYQHRSKPCHCDECKAAHARKIRLWRERHRPQQPWTQLTFPG